MRIYGILVLAGTLGACGTMNEKKDESPTYDSLEADATTRFAAWQAVEPKSYRYLVRHSCFCGIQPQRITVANGQITKVEDPDPTAKTLEWKDANEASAKDAESIASLFDKIHAWARERPDELTVTFDEQFHFPKEFHVDFREGYADDEEGVFVEEFEDLDPTGE